MIGELEVVREAGRGSVIQYGPYIPFNSDNFDLPAEIVSVRLQVFSSEFCKKAGKSRLVFSFQFGSCDGFRFKTERFEEVDAAFKSMTKRFGRLSEFFRHCRREVRFWYPELLRPRRIFGQTVH